MSALAGFVGRLALSLRAGDVLYWGCGAADVAPPEGARACFASGNADELARSGSSRRPAPARPPRR